MTCAVPGAVLLCALTLLPATANAVCIASFYGDGEKLNRHTASGEVFRPNDLTAAHRDLAFGTRVRVHRGERSVDVTVNDRGPAAWTGRCLDLSKGAAIRLDMIDAGTAPVRLEILDD